MASLHSAEIGCSLIVSRSNTCLILFKIYAKVDLEILNVFLNRASEYVFHARSHQPVFRKNRLQERCGTFLLSDRLNNRRTQEIFSNILLLCKALLSAVCIIILRFRLSLINFAIINIFALFAAVERSRWFAMFVFIQSPLTFGT